MKSAVRAIVINDNKILVMHRNKFGHEYYTLPGGGIKSGEDQMGALTRELNEETSVRVDSPKLVFTEDAGAPYGMQYVYLCDYQGGEPVLSPGSEEAKINALGQNIYTPMWLPLEKLESVPFLSTKLRTAINEAIKSGFPETAQAV